MFVEVSLLKKKEEIIFFKVTIVTTSYDTSIKYSLLCYRILGLQLLTLLLLSSHQKVVSSEHISLVRDINIIIIKII